MDSIAPPIFFTMGVGAILLGLRLDTIWLLLAGGFCILFSLLLSVDSRC